MRKRKAMEFLKMRKFAEQFKDLDQIIFDIYENNNGNPDKTMTISCPNCNYETNHFECNWFGNKHINFCCDNCKTCIKQ